MVAADITTVQYVFIINRLSVGVDANICMVKVVLILTVLGVKGPIPCSTKVF